MSAHTPGPWAITGSYGVLTDQVGIGSQTVCTVWTRKQGHRPAGIDAEPWPEGEANARLIAAAPKMWAELEMLRDLLRECRLALIWSADEANDAFLARLDAAIGDDK